MLHVVRIHVAGSSRFKLIIFERAEDVTFDNRIADALYDDGFKVIQRLGGGEETAADWIYGAISQWCHLIERKE
jgi:hypothetical protein